AATLERAFALARELLIVAVRVDDQITPVGICNDGVITAIGTFQKLYTQPELRDYLQQILQRPPRTSELGIMYVFKDEDAEARYLASVAFRRRLAWQQDLI